MRAPKRVPRIKNFLKASSKGFPMGLLTTTNQKKSTLSLLTSLDKFTLKAARANTLRNNFSLFLHLTKLLANLLMSFLNHRFSKTYLTLQLLKTHPQLHPQLQFLHRFQPHYQLILTPIHNPS